MGGGSWAGPSEVYIPLYVIGKEASVWVSWNHNHPFKETATLNM